MANIDPIKIAKTVADKVIKQTLKNPNAVALGKKRWEGVSKEERHRLASLGGKKRWNKPDKSN